MHALRRLLCCCLLVLQLPLLAMPAEADPVIVRYPRAESLDDERGEFGLQLLELALDKAGGHYRVELSESRMQQSRAIVELQSATGRVDVVGTMTTMERERMLLPVRIPITRGLIGWRLGLVRADRKDMLRGVGRLADLNRFTSVQGHDWPDLQILRASGLTVYPAAVYNGMFGMLNAGRIDWAPRSLNEIWAEEGRHPELAIDPHIALHYPAADYFFVNRRNPALAEEIRRGLETALADGSFDQLFYLYFGSLIRRAKLDQRVLIHLPNPLLPPATPLARKELWFTPDDLKRHR
jgi:hypothetical protein